MRGEGVLRLLEGVFLHLDRLTARALPEELSPFAQSGAIANTTFLIALVSGAFYGIIFLRPCHPNPSISEESLRSVLPKLDGLNAPFLVVAHRLENRLRLRIRENLTLR